MIRRIGFSVSKGARCVSAATANVGQMTSSMAASSAALAAPAAMAAGSLVCNRASCNVAVQGGRSYASLASRANVPLFAASATVTSLRSNKVHIKSTANALTSVTKQPFSTSLFSLASLLNNSVSISNNSSSASNVVARAYVCFSSPTSLAFSHSSLSLSVSSLSLLLSRCSFTVAI